MPLLWNDLAPESPEEQPATQVHPSAQREDGFAMAWSWEAVTEGWAGSWGCGGSLRQHP